MRIASLLIVSLLGGCQLDTEPPPPAELGTFPYHPLVYELDLAILSYQVHGQSMVWPTDPFYEEQAGGRGTSRDAMMGLVREWAEREGPAQVQAMAGLDAYRGPGVLAGLDDNPTHDPILYDYARIHPWSDTITNNDGQWTEYLTPKEITGRIREVYVAARPIGGGPVEVTAVAPGRDDWDADATDVLLAFEGGTGDRGEEGQPALYSLMGFVLVRDTPGGGYDLHVTFRGSRSGSAVRAALDALDSDEAKGNPDWITDLGWDTEQVATVTTVGGVHRGFAHAMTSILPALFACLDKAAELRPGVAPTNIYVTGHSLGGGLAQHFASAVLLGDATLPDTVRDWSWENLKLVTFSAPRAGDYTWAAALSEGALDSPFYDPGPLETVDADAHVVLDPSIVERLHDASRPAGFRVLISTDPITTTKIGGAGTHVGTTVYVNGDDLLDWLGVDDPASHEPALVRQDMLDAMDDPRTPPIAWRYRPITDLVPDRIASERGTPPEMVKLADGLRAYYADRGLYFDDVAFSRDVDLRFAIERGDANR